MSKNIVVLTEKISEKRPIKQKRPPDTDLCTYGNLVKNKGGIRSQ